MVPYKLIYITASDQREAERIVRILLKEKLIACANFFPIESLYKWSSFAEASEDKKGEIKKAKEFGVIIKTKAKLVEQVIKRIKELHSYEIPCIISIPIEKGNPEFLKWIDMSTKK